MPRVPRAFVALALAALPIGLATLALMLGADLSPGPLTRVVFELVLAWGFVVCGLWVLAVGRSRWFGYLSVGAACAFFLELWRFSAVSFFYTASLPVAPNVFAALSRNPAETRIGRRALPYMLFFQILIPILAPLIDVFAIYGLLFGDPPRVIAAWLAFNALQLGLAGFAFRLDHEPLRPLWALPLQQFVYRQLMYVVIIESTISALIGARAHWRSIPRTGEVDVATAAAR